MSRLGGFSGQVILPLAHTFDPEEVSSYPTYNLNSLTQFNKVLILNALFVALLFQFLEVIKLGNASTYQDALIHRDLFLLQVTLVPLLHHCEMHHFLTLTKIPCVIELTCPIELCNTSSL